ncbi:MAG: hypothetical protein GXC73_07580, partial [Chitinophagaceae bacterium]|nr:hypothetical protein [Chitinophagaceae bacterium]
MSATATHSIGKLSFHLKGVRTENVFPIRQQAADYLQHAFARMAEEVFDEFALNDELLFIPKISIELKLSGDGFDLKKEEYRLREQIREQIAGQIRLQHSNTSVQDIEMNEQQHAFLTPDANLLLQAWAFYLEYGYLPSYLPLTLWQERLQWWKKTFKQQTQQLKDFFILQFREEQRLKRFLKHTTADEQQWIFDQLHPQLNSILQGGKLKFNRAVPFSHFDKKMYLLYLSANENCFLLKDESPLPAVEWVKRYYELHRQNNTGHLPVDAKKPPQQKNHQRHSEDEESIILQNAGVVLLQPFISTLFHALHLLSEDRKVLIDKERACALLSLLAGDEEQTEVYYPLYKVVCGLTPNEFVDENIVL